MSRYFVSPNTRTDLRIDARELADAIARRWPGAIIQFIDGADLYIGEAQYTDEEYPRRIGWGHSSVSATVEAALASRVASLALFHHDPMHDDATVAGMADTARRLIAARGSAMHCFAAREGAVIDL